MNSTTGEDEDFTPQGDNTPAEGDFAPHADGFVMVAKNPGMSDRQGGSEDVAAPASNRQEKKGQSRYDEQSHSPRERLFGGAPSDLVTSNDKTSPSKSKDRTQSQVSTVPLQLDSQAIETPTDRVRMRASNDPSAGAAPQKVTVKRNNSNLDKIPPIGQVRKQQSLEQIRLIKEHQKIRDFFSKEEEDKDGKSMLAYHQQPFPHHHLRPLGEQQSLSSNKLPVVNKNLRHQQNQFQVPHKVSKKAMSLISQLQTKNPGASGATLPNQASGSLFSETSVPAGNLKNARGNMDNASLDPQKVSNKVVLQKMLLNKKQSGRYQTLEVKLPNHQKNDSNIRRSSELTEQASKDSYHNNTLSMPAGHTANTSNTINQESRTEAGNYDFGTSLSIQKNSLDSLMQPSLQHGSGPNMKTGAHLQNEQQQLHRKVASNSYNISLQEPIRLQATNSIMSYGQQVGGDYGIQYEPSKVRVDGAQSVDRLRFTDSAGFRDFDTSQMKLYTAAKQQQMMQSRQIVNDQLIPQDMSFSTAALHETYQRTFVARAPIGGKKLKVIGRNGHSSSAHKPEEMLSRQISLPASISMGRHDEALHNFSHREKMSIGILLQDQYSSSGAYHAPGEEDPLTSLQVNYEDKQLTKKKRMEAVLASLKLKRRTKFKAIPAKRAFSVQGLNQSHQHNQSKTTGHLQIMDQKELRSPGTASSVEKASPKAITDTAFLPNSKKGFKMDLEPQSAFQKFKQFREMLQKSIDEQGYISQSDDSEKGLKEQNEDLEDNFQDEIFFRRSLRLQKEGKLSLLEIIRKPCNQRDQEEREHFICHLKYRVPFFRNKSRDLIATLVDKLECVEFRRRDSLMDQGEIGDSMYIIYTGECGVYIFKSEHDGLSGSHKAVAILGANTAVGETAVVDKFDDGLRTATVVAHTDVVAVRLTKTDYQRILYQFQIMERQRRYEFLANLPFFKLWDRVNLVDLNTMTEELKLTKDTTLYDIGQDPHTVYVCRRGKLVQETIIEIDSYFRYPIDKKSWEIRKTTREICYKLQDITMGKIFGHEEILQGYKRRCRVRCITDCTLIYINGEQMLKRWPSERVEYLKKNMRNLDLDFMVNKITRYYKEKTKRNAAILDGAQINCHDFSGERAQFMKMNEQNKIQKMLPWINKCRQNSTQDLNLLHELKKVLLLAQREEKFVISKDDPKVMMPTDEFMEKKHARFVMPEEAKKNVDAQHAMVKGLNRKRREQRHSPKRSSLMGSSNLERIKNESKMAMQGAVPWLQATPKDNFNIGKNPTV